MNEPTAGDLAIDAENAAERASAHVAIAADACFKGKPEEAMQHLKAAEHEFAGGLASLYALLGAKPC